MQDIGNDIGNDKNQFGMTYQQQIQQQEQFQQQQHLQIQQQEQFGQQLRQIVATSIQKTWPTQPHNGHQMNSHEPQYPQYVQEHDRNCSQYMYSRLEESQKPMEPKPGVEAGVAVAAACKEINF